MNKISFYSIISTAAVIALSFSPVAALAAGLTSGSYTVDPATSVIEWSATKVGGGHNGTVPVSGGNLTVTKGKIVDGSAVINMTGVVSVDLSGETKTRLETHLKSADFFDVAKYPEAKFALTSVKPLNVKKNTYRVVGKLTIKDKTIPVAFNATITEKDGVINATSNRFSINRTKFGVNYGSNIIGTLKDKLISNLFKVKITMNAKLDQVSELKQQ